MLLLFSHPGLLFIGLDIFLNAGPGKLRRSVTAYARSNVQPPSCFLVIRCKVAALRWEVWTSAASNDRGPRTVNPSSG